MSRRKMSQIGTEQVRELIENTGLGRSQLAEALDESVAAINIWISRGRIPSDVVGKIKAIESSRSRMQRFKTKSGHVIEADIVQLSPERLEELSKEGHVSHKLGGIAQDEPDNSLLKSFKAEALVLELEQRGWKVQISRKTEEK